MENKRKKKKFCWLVIKNKWRDIGQNNLKQYLMNEL